MNIEEIRNRYQNEMLQDTNLVIQGDLTPDKYKEKYCANDNVPWIEVGDNEAMGAKPLIMNYADFATMIYGTKISEYDAPSICDIYTSTDNDCDYVVNLWCYLKFANFHLLQVARIELNNEGKVLKVVSVRAPASEKILT